MNEVLLAWFIVQITLSSGLSQTCRQYTLLAGDPGNVIKSLIIGLSNDCTDLLRIIQNPSEEFFLHGYYLQMKTEYTKDLNKLIKEMEQANWGANLEDNNYNTGCWEKKVTLTESSSAATILMDISLEIPSKKFGFRGFQVTGIPLKFRKENLFPLIDRSLTCSNYQLLLIEQDEVSKRLIAVISEDCTRILRLLASPHQPFIIEDGSFWMHVDWNHIKEYPNLYADYETMKEFGNLMADCDYNILGIIEKCTLKQGKEVNIKSNSLHIKIRDDNDSVRTELVIPLCVSLSGGIGFGEL